MPATSGQPARSTDEPGPESTPKSAKATWKARLLGLEKALNRRAGSAKSRQSLLAFALVLFVVISYLSFRSLPAGTRFHWWALPLLVVVTTPLMVLANSAEFRVMGLINGHRIAWMPAARLTVIAGAANLLPLPGGIMIRTQALRSHGSSYRHALAANAAAGIAWISAGCLSISALFAAGSHTRWAALALALVGIGSTLTVAVILRRIDRTTAARNMLALFMVEGATVVISGVRIFLAFRLIGLSATAAQSVALTASQIIAAAVGIFPAGLGLRELLAGGIGAVVNLRVSDSIAATAADRITGQLGLALLAGVMLLAGRRTGDPLPSEADIEGVPAVPTSPTS